MNVASLENCKELYKLSGWDDCSLMWSNIDVVWRVVKVGDIPAYDLGFLLRKFRAENIVVNLLDVTNRWIADAGGFGTGQADTPEDAACKLAIELFKQGVLDKEL